MIYLKGKDVIKKMQSILDSAKRKFFPLKLEKNVITSEQSDVIHQQRGGKANEVRRTSVAKSVHKITRMRTTMQLNIININSHRS